MKVMKTRPHVTEEKKQTHFNSEVCVGVKDMYMQVYLKIFNNVVYVYVQSESLFNVSVNFFILMERKKSV